MRLLSTIVTSCLLIFPACREDDDEIPISLIGFSANVQAISEGDEVIISLTLDRPAPGYGTVKLNVEGSAIYSEHYVTSPLLRDSSIVLTFYKGHKSSALKVTSKDNHKFEGSHFIVIQLSDPTGGVRLGQNTMLTVVFTDDEGPSLAGFSASGATLGEQYADGIEVRIPFSVPAKGEGSITVTLHEGQAVRGTDFTIDQELVNNSFSFNVVRNSSGVSFKVFPVDNDLFKGNFILHFSITDISGVLQKGSTAEYSLTLQDDEAPSIARFSLPSGSINESGGEGIDVEISLSSPVKGTGTLGITLASSSLVYGTDFTTVPEMQNNSINLALSHNQTSASFAVFPVDNDVPAGDQTVLFSIHETSGVAWKGSDSLKYELTIIDDE